MMNDVYKLFVSCKLLPLIKITKPFYLKRRALKHQDDLDDMIFENTIEQKENSRISSGLLC